MNYRHKIVIDFETFWDRKKKYSLGSMTALEYIMHPLFQIILVSVKVDNNPTVYMTGHDMEALCAYLRSLPWHDTAVIGHNGAFFDFLILGWIFGIVPKHYADTLLMARPLLGIKQSASLAALCEHFGLKAKGEEVKLAEGLRLEHMTPQFLASYAAYCCGDTDRCGEIFNILVQYWRPVDLAWISVCCRMGANPQISLDMDVIQEGLAKEAERKVDVLDQLADQVMYSQIQLPEEAYKKKRKSDPDPTPQEALTKVVGSTAMCVWLLEQFGCSVPEKYSEKQKKMVPALAKSDHQFTDLQDSDIPGVPELVRARLGIKSTIMVSRLERLQLIGERMPQHMLPIPIEPFKAHCVPGETEVLTPEGWVALTEWDGGRIMQYDRTTRALRWGDATRFVGPIERNWVFTEGRVPYAPMTTGHRVPVLYPRNKGEDFISDIPAIRLTTSSRTYMVRSGEFDDGEGIGSDLVRLIALIHATGAIAWSTSGSPRWRTGHSDPERRKAMSAVCEAAGLPPIPPAGIYRVLSSGWPAGWKDEYSHLGPWLLRDLSGGERDLFLREMVRWRKTCVKVYGNYSTTNQQEAEWVSTLAHLCGHRASRVRVATVRQTKTGVSRRYEMTIKFDCTVSPINCKRVKLRESYMRSYCTRTETGYWLARYRSVVFVTGNTGRNAGAQKINPQNFSARKGPNNPDGKANAARRSMCAPPGHIMIDADLSQIEVRVLGALSGEPNILGPFSREGFDPYCGFGSKLYGRVITKADKKERDVSKSAVLGNGYGQGALGYQGYVRRGAGIIIDLDEADRVVKVYRQEHPRVVAFWRECDGALDWIMSGREGTFGYRGCLRVRGNAIILPSGRPIFYRGLEYREVWDDRTQTTKRERMFYDPVKRTFRRVYGSLVTENVTQGCAADVVHEQGVRLAEIGFHPALQVHDSLVFICPDTPAWIASARYHIPNEMRKTPSWLPWLPVAMSYEEGPNYGATEEVTLAA